MYYVCSIASDACWIMHRAVYDTVAGAYLYASHMVYVYVYCMHVLHLMYVHMYVYVCMYACTYVRMYVCVYACMCVCMYRIWCMLHTCIASDVCTCMYVSHLMYIFVYHIWCLYLCMHCIWCMFVCIVSDVRMYVCMYVSYRCWWRQFSLNCVWHYKCLFPDMSPQPLLCRPVFMHLLFAYLCGIVSLCVCLLSVQIWCAVSRFAMFVLFSVCTCSTSGSECVCLLLVE